MDGYAGVRNTTCYLYYRTVRYLLSSAAVPTLLCLMFCCDAPMLAGIVGIVRMTGIFPFHA